ncbi:putative urease accessory protein UreF, partial [Grifola frondosa]
QSCTFSSSGTFHCKIVMDSDHEAYILLLLSDGNLPTGSFVASAGLESYVTHGFFSTTQSTPVDKLDATTNFIRDSLATYARSTLPYVSDAHEIVRELLLDIPQEGEDSLGRAISKIRTLDDLYEAMTLNHVARRASKSQGVALLTLFTKGFSKPTFLVNNTSTEGAEVDKEACAVTLVNKLKLLVRREDTHGHLPICWGVLTAVLGLSLERSQSLHLFLHARSLLSASVRLNTIGPYAAQQLLLHAVRPLVEAETVKCRDLRTGYDATADSDLDKVTNGPATTWPLGEILAARHDLQHSRIFNS